MITTRTSSTLGAADKAKAGPVHYRIDWQGQVGVQSSSGVIVSTGRMASVIIDLLRIGAAWEGESRSIGYQPLAWDAPALRFAVREPFPSRATGASLVYGEVDSQHPLALTSQMP
jgi:hypothetical protein